MRELLARIGEVRTPLRQSARPETGPQSEHAFLAVGDLHGRADLLLELDRLIEDRYIDWPVVFLGDYVDRGERTREVLELLMSVSAGSTPMATCLMGNHERMLLDFLDTPDKSVRRWLHNGGLQTLASFGVTLPKRHFDDPVAQEALRDDLAEKMGEPVIDWLRARPLKWHSGNVWAVHAGADPDKPMDAQSPDVLLWGHPRFRRQRRRDGQWIVHGHTVVDAPVACENRIAVDTGAYATGRLSAVAISPDGVTFLQVGAG